MASPPKERDLRRLLILISIYSQFNDFSYCGIPKKSGYTKLKLTKPPKEKAKSLKVHV
jgi:hypothetical protein